MSATREKKSQFGKTPSAMLKDFYFLVAAAYDTRGPEGKAVMPIYDPIRRALRPVMMKKNIYSEWAKLQKWLHTRRHFVGGRVTGRVRKGNPKQLSLDL